MKFLVGDKLNGFFKIFSTEIDARACYEEEVRQGIITEKEAQDESGLSDKQIEEKVRDFFFVAMESDDEEEISFI